MGWRSHLDWGPLFHDGLSSWNDIKSTFTSCIRAMQLVERQEIYTAWPIPFSSTGRGTSDYCSSDASTAPSINLPETKPVRLLSHQYHSDASEHLDPKSLISRATAQSNTESAVHQAMPRFTEAAIPVAARGLQEPLNWATSQSSTLLHLCQFCDPVEVNVSRNLHTESPCKAWLYACAI
jgi:hypothetical protein